MMNKFEVPQDPSNQESIEKKEKDIKIHTRRWQNALRAMLAGVMLTVPNSANVERREALDTFSNRTVAEAQLKEFGTTDERSEARTILSKTLERGLSPFRYTPDEGDASTPFEDVSRVLDALAEGSISDKNEETKDKMVKEIQEKYHLTPDVAESFYNARMDAFRMYIGLPQEHDTFGISEYKPSKSKEDKYYYKINEFVERYSQAQKAYEKGHFGDDEFARPLTEEEALRMLYFSATENPNPEFPNIDSSAGIMGYYVLNRGEDERGIYVSYYDNWNLGGSVEGETGVIGAPFEVYDRVYIDDPSILEIKPLELRFRSDEVE